MSASSFRAARAVAAAGAVVAGVVTADVAAAGVAADAATAGVRAAGAAWPGAGWAAVWRGAAGWVSAAVRGSGVMGRERTGPHGRPGRQGNGGPAAAVVIADAGTVAGWHAGGQPAGGWPYPVSIERVMKPFMPVSGCSGVLHVVGGWQGPRDPVTGPCVSRPVSVSLPCHRDGGAKKPVLRYTDRSFISARVTGVHGVSREALKPGHARRCVHWAVVVFRRRQCRGARSWHVLNSGLRCSSGTAAVLCGRDGMAPPAGLLSAGGCTSVRMAGDCVFLRRAGWFSW